MEIEIRLDSSRTEPKLLILTDKVTDEINRLLKKLSEESPQVLAGFKDDTLELLEQQEIIRVYSAAGKVFAVTSAGEYLLKLRLYELEERLDKNSFVRISNSEIINLKKTRRFDLSLAGTICVSLTDGTTSYASRRYVSKIKQILGI